MTASNLEVVLASAVALAGIALTSVGAVSHATVAFAPGGLLILLGGAWLGNALARRGVRLSRGAHPQRETETR